MGRIPTKIPKWNGMHSACVDADGVEVAGQAVTNGVALVFSHVLGNVTNWRLHFSTDADGTLSARYYRAGYDDLFLAAGNPSNVTVTGGTATKMDVTQHFGEYAVEFTFTPSEDGTIDYADICGVTPAGM